MAKIASDVLIERLADWGVDTVFGLPGDGINGIMEGLRRHWTGPVLPGASRGSRGVHGHGIRQGDREARRLPGHVRSRRDPPDERPLRRKGGRCRCWRSPACRNLRSRHRLPAGGAHRPAVRGPGRVQPRRRQPGAAARRGRHRDQDGAGPARCRAPQPSQRRAGGGRRRGPVPACGAGPAAGHRAGWLAAPGRARTEELEAAARVLNEGEKVAILAGAGALHAREEVLAVADLLGAPVIKTLPGKAVIPDDRSTPWAGSGCSGPVPASSWSRTATRCS